MVHFIPTMATEPRETVVAIALHASYAIVVAVLTEKGLLVECKSSCSQFRSRNDDHPLS